MSIDQPQLFLNPDAIQARHSITGVQREDGWCQVNALSWKAFPSVVRFLAYQTKEGEIRNLGSGTIIGSIRDCLIICTASHVFDFLGEVFGKRPNRQLLQSETPEEKAARRFDPDSFAKVRCGVTIPELDREAFCVIVGIDYSANHLISDFALVLVKLPPEASGKTVIWPIDVGPPPMRDRSLTVLGFNGDRDEEFIPVNCPGLKASVRKPIVREGFLNGFGNHSMLQYDVARVSVPIDAGMSGGPVIIYRPEGLHATPVVVAIANSEIERKEGTDQACGFATPVIAMFARGLHTPDGEQLTFSEAITAGYIKTFGPEVHHVKTFNGV